MAGKQLSRVTSQDRVLTVNDLFDPNERPHGAVMSLKETKSLVDHSTQAHIFATKAELDAFVEEQSALSEGERTVKVGDNLYITDTGVPDYWWIGEEPWISELESGGSLSRGTDITIGEGAVVCPTGENAVAIGGSATVSIGTTGDGNGGVAIGYLSRAREQSVAIGGRICNGGRYGASAHCVRSIAIGAATTAVGDSVMIGTNIGCGEACSVIIGGVSDTFNGSHSVVLGSGARSSSFYTTAVGRGAFAAGPGSVAVGADSGACSQFAVSIGRQAAARGVGSVAIGVGANAGDCAGFSYNIAIGPSASVEHGGDTVVIGPYARNSGLSSDVIIGAYADSHGASRSGSVVIGAGASITGGGIVIGEQARDSGWSPNYEAAVVIGQYASGTALGASVIGNDTANGAATSLMLSAIDRTEGMEAFLRIGVCAGGGCASEDSFLDVGLVDRLTGAVSEGARVSIRNFVSFLRSTVGGTDVPDMVASSCCSDY